ncbi:sugar phosphate nucleotidyltransferase [Candidatus Pelagibacter sp.]|nr:sugar phosphate nucleotidyltransferase [Candidatus Pelagibacter sp.]
MQNYKKIIILENQSIKEALKLLSNTKIKCLIVINKKKEVLGTITDGDIRRSLLRGKTLKTKLKDIYNKRFTFFYDDEFKNNQIQREFEKFKNLKIIPILKKNNQISSIYSSSNFFNFLVDTKKKYNKTKILIMAGGFGTRLAPATNVLPKPLLPIGTKTLVEVVIDKFYQQRFNNFVLSIYYKKDLIKAYFKEQNNKYKLEYIDEKKPLGTAGSLFYLKKYKDKNFIVSNCDNIIDTDYHSLMASHEKNKNDITIVGAKKKFLLPYGILETDKTNNLVTIKEKPNLNFIINSGLYVISKKVVQNLKTKKKIDMNELINQSIKKRLKVGVFSLSENSWTEVGQWKEFNKFKKDNNFKF